MLLIDLVERLKAHTLLEGLSLDILMTFTRLASHLKRDILQPQVISQSDPGYAPDKLPASVSNFLGDALGISNECIHQCWGLLNDYIWDMPTTPLSSDDYRLFKEHGWEYGISCVINSNDPV